MEDTFTPQAKLSKESVLAEYAQTGLDPDFAELFWQKYSEKYDSYRNEMPYEDDISDYALEYSRNWIPWFILYLEIGHPEDWCRMAGDCGAYDYPGDFSFEGVSWCLWNVYHLLREEAFQKNKGVGVDALNPELKRHCEYIGEKYGKSDVYMRYFYEWYKEEGLDRHMFEYFQQEEYLYNEAIEKGKSNRFADYYAGRIDLSSKDAWKLAELKEKLEKEGKDRFYVELYLQKYAEGMREDGEEREHPAIPAWWEEKVEAYMKGWEYARSRHLDEHRFATLFRDIFLNMSHPDDIPNYPFSEVEERAIKETIKRYEAGSSR